MAWKNGAIEITQRPDVDYYFFVDESGEHMLKNFDNTRPVFTVAGVLISKEEYDNIKNDFNLLKLKYWKNGQYKEKNSIKKVCLISRAIRRRQRAFSKYYLDEEQYKKFISDLSILIEKSKFNIISACIDKNKLVNQYKYPKEPYSLAMEFIVERLCKFLNSKKSTAFVMMESRGKKEDGLLHQKFLSFFNNGTEYLSYRIVQRVLPGGFYFNPKWQDNNQDTYIGLELADLIAYPIGHFALKKEKRRSFKIFESKFLGYKNYIGRGLKIFP